MTREEQITFMDGAEARHETRKTGYYWVQADAAETCGLGAHFAAYWDGEDWLAVGSDEPLSLGHWGEWSAYPLDPEVMNALADGRSEIVEVERFPPISDSLMQYGTVKVSGEMLSLAVSRVIAEVHGE